MPHDKNQYNTWLDVTKHLPESEWRMYWVSDGKNVSLANFMIAIKSWCYKYMTAALKPKYFMPIKLITCQKPPEEKEVNNGQHRRNKSF